MAKGKVTFDVDRCKGCALCTTVCPVNIVAIDKTKINAKGYNPASVTEPEKCIGCANCATMCPDCVITVERD
ncbi:MAG: 4Fe-4S dicluster domain-containing protein [Peptoclostridium sp.]|uniref:4Fe-4S dicluster domain-containing protein n=1 Tax=Peptoclostridium sp. TaxID=1904860 RepID=UPI00139DCC7A|nr:4Fe-4S dicluster domain-containing protein [Peptoclostridium sp.]MZQ74540.1 4Fe-4S dicluster domain-containing protein [Peptoclostridium sp.]